MKAFVLKQNRVNEAYFGLKRNRATRKAILTLCLSTEGRIKKNKDTYGVYLKKVFDNVKLNKLFEILRKFGFKYNDRKMIF